MYVTIEAWNISVEIFRIPVGRVGKPEEIAQLIEAVLDNGFITGGVFDIDGGGSL